MSSIFTPGASLGLKAMTSLSSKHTTQSADDETSDIYQVLINLQSSSSTRVPTNIIFVIDVSGSMGEVATPADASGASKESGTQLTNLDIVKHAIKAASKMCSEQDSIALVKFNNRASIEMPLTKMDIAGQTAVDEKLEHMMHGGSTNIWEGLLMGLEAAKTNQASSLAVPNANTCVLLLTDGVPNINPPAGILPSIIAYRDSLGGTLPATITTFGFGYNLESKLLMDIAANAGGMYSFIPDASFCGTTFINTVSNLMCSQVKDLVVNFTPKAGVTIIPDEQCNEYAEIRNASGVQMKRAAIQCGQSFSFLKTLSAPKNFPVHELFQVIAECKMVGQTGTVNATGSLHSGREDIDELDVNIWRLRFVNDIRKAHNLLFENYSRNATAAKALVLSLNSDMRMWIDANGAQMTPSKLAALTDLLKDIEGQVTEAIASTEYYTKWGKHYLPSLVRAHELQQANNFKDPGVQHYGGDLFKTIRDAAEDIYITLPPPKSTAPKYTSYYNPSGGSSSTSSSSSYASSSVASMTNYHNRSAGCIYGASSMTLQSGNIVLAKDLKRGDILNNGNTIKCIWKTNLLDNQAELCHLPGGLVITPYHPVKWNGSWAFPIDISKPERTSADSVYSFLLETEEGRFGPSYVACGIEVVALAHGIEGDKVASHDFFGTIKIVENLKQSKGWEAGLVTVHQTAVGDIFTRNSRTGRVNGINVEDQVEEIKEQSKDDRLQTETYFASEFPPSLSLPNTQTLCSF